MQEGDGREDNLTERELGLVLSLLALAHSPRAYTIASSPLQISKEMGVRTVCLCVGLVAEHRDSLEASILRLQESGTVTQLSLLERKHTTGARFVHGPESTSVLLYLICFSQEGISLSEMQPAVCCTSVGYVKGRIHIESPSRRLSKGGTISYQGGR